MRAAVLLLLPLLAACGPGTPTGDLAAPTPVASVAVDAAALLAGIPAAAEAAGSVTYEAVTKGGLDGEELAVEAKMSGALDTSADAGTAQLALVGLDEWVAEADSEGEQEVADDIAGLARAQLSWTATDLTLHMGGEQVTGPRADADSGMFARVPGEPAGLFEVVADAQDVEVVGAEQVDGVATTHLRGSARPKDAVDAGLGTQAQLTIARLPDLPVEVWVDGAGRPARIRYTVELPSLQEGRTRTMVTTYDYRDWGQPVDVTP